MSKTRARGKEYTPIVIMKKQVFNFFRSCEISPDDVLIHDHMQSDARVMKSRITYCAKNLVRRRQRHVLHAHKERKKLINGLLCTEEMILRRSW